MFLETDAIVLKTTKSTNNDLFLTLFSKKAGKIEVVANGAKSSKSPLASCSKPFVFGLFMISGSGKTLRLNSCSIHDSNFRITESLEKLAMGSYILELCNLSTQVNYIDYDHYVLLVEMMDLLSHKEMDLKLLQAVYLAKLAKISGHMPNLTAQCLVCKKNNEDYIFAVEEGGLIHKGCTQEGFKYYKLNVTFIQIMQYLMVKDVRVIVKTKIHDEYITKIITVLETYLMHHLSISHINSKLFMDTIK